MPPENAPDPDKSQPSNDQNTATPAASPKPILFRRSVLASLLIVIVLLVGFGLFYSGLGKPPEWAQFWLPVTLNALLLMVVVVQAFIYKKQWDAMDRQVRMATNQWEAMSRQVELMDKQSEIMRETLDETRRIVGHNERAVIASEIQSVASQESARAAEQSVELNQRFFYIGERPYVFLGRAYLEAPLSSGSYPVTQLEFENTGRTPAFNCRVMVYAALLTGKAREMAERGVMPNPGKSPTVSPATIAAGRFTRMATPQHDWDSPETKELTLQGATVYYVWGEILYSDIFGKEHCSRFCMYPEALNSRLFSFSPHGNKIDTE